MWTAPMRVLVAARAPGLLLGAARWPVLSAVAVAQRPHSSWSRPAKLCSPVALPRPILHGQCYPLPSLRMVASTTPGAGAGQHKDKPPVSADLPSGSSGTTATTSTTTSTTSTTTSGKPSFWTDLKAKMKVFWTSTKSLYSDIRASRRWRRKVKESGGDFRVLTRAEYRVVRETRRDLLKMMPLLILFCVPTIGYGAPLLGYMFPRQLLSKQFLDSDQKALFRKAEYEERSQHYDAVLSAALTAADRTGQPDNELSALAASYMQLIDATRARRTQPMAPDFVQFSKLFVAGEMNLMDLRRAEVKSIASALNMSSLWPTVALRSRTRSRMRDIYHDDILIKREGVASLSDEDLRDACADRGMPAQDMDSDALRARLDNWIKLSTESTSRHLPALLVQAMCATNFPQ